MVIPASRMRKKGQLTVPREVRQDLGLNEDDIVYFDKQDGRYFLSPAQEFVDIARGSLAEFAKFRDPDASEERAWVARHIAETADDYE